ncbi:hypothetical protein K2173_023449 [Erythroxylum novogranatense]|uniref:Uncharacterized protein n=1 Tax=Erythroxylum novogranatense TaxID=1862640 RepID=A0AAV8TYI9_9ROSI|nr:hypothetical protein K2173_023449 [Erythroxylum novogranatense]
MAELSATSDMFDAYFRRADLDDDSHISGAEGVGFFQGYGLSKQVLAQVWMHVDQKGAGFLGRQEFYNTLKLVTVAQGKKELTPEIVRAALYIDCQHICNTTNCWHQTTTGTGTVSTNHQFSQTQPNQYPRPTQVVLPIPMSRPQQLPAGQMVSRGSNTGAPHSPSSSVSTNLLAGNTSGSATLIPGRGIVLHTSQDGFGMAMPGFAPTGQSKPQMTVELMPSAVPKAQNVSLISNQHVTEDSKKSSQNVFPSDSLFGDVLAATPIQLNQRSSPTASSIGNISYSSTIVPSSGGFQASSGPPIGRKNELANVQTIATPGFSVGAGSAVSNQSQPQWPRMTQSDIQKYTRVFIQVDTDRDGKLTGEQARSLFLSWRLTRVSLGDSEILKKLWDLSD